jgi:hypothetical protein
MISYDNELSKAQIARQDYVDNTIQTLINDLLPQGTELELDWDIERISVVRDAVQDVIVEALAIPIEEQDAFQMRFYPYLRM